MQGEDRLEEQIANLDVALFSLIEPLDADVSQIAGVLDEVLKDSLWKRTLAREEEPTRQLERELLRSRAEWLWRSTSADQRQACFYSGLGRKPVFFFTSSSTPWWMCCANSKMQWRQTTVTQQPLLQ